MQCRQYVYAVVASAANEFAEMAAVSSYLLKKADPAARIIAFVDPTHDDLGRAAYQIMSDTGVELRPVEIPGDDPIYRSRWLKISLRRLVDGRFVFLDTDTLPLAGVADIFAFNKDLAGVRDPDSITRVTSPAFSALGWELHQSVFLNGGVLAWGASEAASALANTWLEYYKQGYAVGEKRDQPALNLAIQKTAVPIERIPSAFNVTIRKHPLRVRNARIIHTYTGIGTSRFEVVNDTVLHVASHRLKTEAVFHTEMLDVFSKTGNPWIKCTTWRQAFGVRDYRRAAVLMVARILERPLTGIKFTAFGKRRTPQ